MKRLDWFSVALGLDRSREKNALHLLIATAGQPYPWLQILTSHGYPTVEASTMTSTDSIRLTMARRSRVRIAIDGCIIRFDSISAKYCPPLADGLMQH